MHSSKTPPSINSDAWPPATPSPGVEDCEAVIEKTKDLQNSSMTASQRPFQRTKIRLASAFFAYFVVGWGDGGNVQDSVDPLGHTVNGVHTAPGPQ